MKVELIVEIFTAPPYDLESAFRKGASMGVDAILPLASPVLADRQGSALDAAMKYRWPSIGVQARYAEAGHLLSYSINPVTGVARAADIAVSILKGAKAGEIQIELPTHFEFVVNMKTAKAFGLTMPAEILVRADRLIQ